MSGCPHDIPAMRISKGGDSDRPQVSNDVSSGHLMYNTDHNYLEIYHSDSNNPTDWRDLIINNKEYIDISGTVRSDGKILYSNMYETTHDLPNATTYHGMFAHVHSDGGAYFSHANQWERLAHFDRLEDLSLAVDEGGSREDVSINSAAITFLAGLLFDLSLSVDAGAGGISPGQDVSFHDIDASGYIAADGNIAAGGDITAVGDITAFFSSSDERLKKNIYDISNYENIIKNVRGVRFNWNDEAKNINSNVDLSKVELGVIAQEVEDYIPEIIKDGIGKYKAVRYEKITPILIECIKDLYTKVEKLEEEVRILKM